MYDKIHQTIGFTIEVNFYEYYHYQYNAYLYWIFILFNKGSSENSDHIVR